MNVPKVYTLTYQIKDSKEDDLHTFTAESDEHANQVVKEFLKKKGGKFIKLKLSENR